MKISIIDDEQDARTTIKEFLNLYAKFDFTLSEADSINGGISVIKKVNPDVLFLDINFPTGTGFDILNEFPASKFQVIFTTAYDTHAIKAFRYSAVDYLLKPIDPDDFAEALKKVKEAKLEDLQRRVNHLESIAAHGVFKKMAFPSNKGTMYIEVEEIVHLISDGNYTIVHTNNNQKYVVSRIIKEFEELLPSTLFFRTHKSHIVNLKHVNEFRRSDESLILSNGHEIPVARRRKEDLMAFLG